MFCVMLLGLCLVSASAPDVSAAPSDLHFATMDDCVDCPDAHHHGGPEGTMPNCHHVAGAALAPLPDVALLPNVATESAHHDRPRSRSGPHRVPERDLPPPRA